jgi:nucleotide-binding universal stress UspA family protein
VARPAPRKHRRVAAPVLAAYDPLTRDRAPVRFGAAIAALAGTRLVVASVYADDDVVDRLTGAQGEEDLTRDPQPALDAVLAELRAEGTEADWSALGSASVAAALDLAVAALGASLLVVGSARGAASGHVSAGTTGQRLLSGAQRPVALVPRDWAGDAQRWLRDDVTTTIGAGLVHAAEGRAAVRSGQALATRAGARMCVLTVVTPRAWMAGDDLADDVRRRAEDAADEDAGTPLGAPVDVDVVVGEPADALIAASAELDMLVCGARRYGPPGAVLLGAVTRRLTAEAACPVIVLSRGDDAGLEALLAEA